MGLVAAEITDACIYWVLKRAEDGLEAAQVARRIRQMTPRQIREARSEYARSDQAVKGEKWTPPKPQTP